MLFAPRTLLRTLRDQETAQKRLALAAAALPVLQVPLHAFSLVVPYLVALLEAFSPEAKEAGTRKSTSPNNNTTEAGRGCAASGATVDPSGALLRQERGGVNATRREGRRQRQDRLGALTGSTGLSAPVEPPTSMAQGESQPPRLAAAAAVTMETRATEPEDAEASAQVEAEVAPEMEALEAAKHAAVWVSVFDLCAARLGPSLAAEVLLPSVLATLER